MGAKWSQNGARGHLVECARTIVFTVREAYREVWGRLREPTFYKPRLLTLPGGVSERIFADFGRFGGPWGGLLGMKMCTFWGLGKELKKDPALAGAGGRGLAPLGLQNLQIMVLVQSRPVP